MEGLDVVGDISPALEATEEDFLHCLGGSPDTGQSHARPYNNKGDDVASRQKSSKQLQDASSVALGKLSSSGVWGLLAARDQHPEVGPLGLAWTTVPGDHQGTPPSAFSVLGLGGFGGGGGGLRYGKRCRARSTNDLAAQAKDSTAASNCSSTTSSSTNSAFKKGHNRSRSDVNYRPSAYTDNGLLTVDGNALKNMALNHLREADKGSSSGGSSVVKQGQLEQREGPRGRWAPCHVELTPCELRLYTLDSSANLTLGTAYSLSHCQSLACPAPSGGQPQPSDPRTLQALFFNSTRVQLRAGSQWDALEWRRMMWERVLAARPPSHTQRVTSEAQRVPSDTQRVPSEAQRVPSQTTKENQQVAMFPTTPMSATSSPSPSGLDTRPDRTPTPAEATPSPLAPPRLVRPTALPLFTQRCQEVIKVGLLHKLTEQNNWRAFTFVLTRSALRAFPTEGRGPVAEPLFQHPLSCCVAVQHGGAAGAGHPQQENADPWSGGGSAHSGRHFQVVFSTEVMELQADSRSSARDWAEALRQAAGAQRPVRREAEEVGGEAVPVAAPPAAGSSHNGGGVLLRARPANQRRQRGDSAQRAKRQSVTTSFLSILTCLAVEKGLTAQSFRCAGCQRPVGLSRGKAKVCCYSGWYYCNSCHQDSTFLVPARLLHNWDTSKHKVSKQAKEFLEFVYEEPLLDVQRLNPCLYEHCEALSATLRLRQQLQSLRAYLFSCRAAVAEDLRRRIFPREYLLQHIHLYSLSDLQQVIDGKLAPFLSKVIKFASGHVMGCSLCREKGFICELCHDQQVIYPFQDATTRRCDGCGAVFHAECRLKAQPCPRCVRKELHHTRPPNASSWTPEDPYHDL